MNLKSILLIIIVISFLGCSKTIKKDSNVVNPHSEKNDEIYAAGIEEADKPAKGLKLSSLLCYLAVDPEPEKFARKHGIILINGKVRVYISFNPASSKLERGTLAENYNFMVEKKSNDLSRALVPIDKLIPLSKESIVWSIRLPDRAIKQ
jgi:hypothetical protein